MRRRGITRYRAAVISITLATAGELWAGGDVVPSLDVCTKADFEAAVDHAAAALRGLNKKNKPVFQENLRKLKEKRGWGHDAFLKEAVPFVRDDRIAVFDQHSERLLSDISTMGQAGAQAKPPDCKRLLELKARMNVLVETQASKWTYMFEKLDAALWE